MSYSRILFLVGLPFLALGFALMSSYTPPAAIGQDNSAGSLYLPMIAGPFPTPTPTPTLTPTPTRTPSPTRTPTATPTQRPSATLPPLGTSEWTQHAANAQRTSYNPSSVPAPWRWKWAWNGSNASGGITSGKFGLPRNSQPVTGGGQVYIAAGSRGVFALDNADGSQLWNRTLGGAVNSTPAYDADTQALFVIATNGTLYKLNASNGATVDSFASGSSSTLPLPPAIAGDRVYFSMGNAVYAVDKNSMQQAWRYDAGSAVDTPPAYSATRDFVVVASRDLYVHAIRNSNGSRAWRTKTSVLTGGDPRGTDNNDLAEVARGWPVIAEQNGVVLIKLRLDWRTLWHWNPWPSNNSTMHSNLTNDPDEQALLALDLDNGSTAFIPNIGHGGYGDGDYMPMGPQPVVKRFDDGTEVAYVVMRASPCLNDPCDGRWDSRLGEMMLNDNTVSGMSAGYVRFMENTFFPTDEQANLSMAGDQIFGGHWMFGIAHQITDRSSSRGTSGSNPITTSDLPHIITSSTSCGFSSSHYCPNGLIQDGDSRAIPGGFYIYYNQGTVYDRYWSEYASWVVSGDTIYYVSTDGAVVALENGQPAGVALQVPVDTAAPSTVTYADTTVVDYTMAAAFAGQSVTVEGSLQDVFNNGKAVYLGFRKPHSGAFLVRIMQPSWANFAQRPETLFAPGQRIQVTGTIGWYQGDPVMYVTGPEQIKVLDPRSGS